MRVPHQDTDFFSLDYHEQALGDPIGAWPFRLEVTSQLRVDTRTRFLRTASCRMQRLILLHPIERDDDR